MEARKAESRVTNDYDNIHKYEGFQKHDCRPIPSSDSMDLNCVRTLIFPETFFQSILQFPQQSPLMILVASSWFIGWLEEYPVDRLGQHLSLGPSDKKDSATNLPWMDFMSSILCTFDQSFNMPMFFILLRIIQELFPWTLQEEQSIFPIPWYSFHTFSILSQPPETSFWTGPSRPNPTRAPDYKW